MVVSIVSLHTAWGFKDDTISDHTVYIDPQREGNHGYQEFDGYKWKKIHGSIQRSYKPESKIIKPKVCFVKDKYCNSQEEWDLLVKPYMEEW